MTLRSFFESTRGVVSVYAALTILFTWPLVSVLATHLPHGSNDIWQNLWNFWWWREALVELGTNPYGTEFLFHPHGASLVLHTHSTFNQIAAFPINLLLGPIAALNFATLLGFFLSGVAAHQLAFEISKNRAGAYMAGLIFAFFPHHFEQSLEHINLSSLQFLPWVALYGLRIARQGSRRDSMMFGAMFALNALSCLHYALFTLFILPFIWAVEWVRAADRVRSAQRLASRLLLSAAVFGVVLAPVVFLMLFQMSGVELYTKLPIDKGIDLAFFFVPSDHHPLLGAFTEAYYSSHRAYPQLGSQAYLGYTAVFLAALALVRARSDRSVIAWTLIGASSMVLAVGAHPTFGGRELGITLPHALFEYLPILRSLRVANRFIVIVMLALSVLASIGFATGLHKRRYAAAVFIALIGFEFLWLPYPVQRVDFSPILDQLADEAQGAILDIPLLGDSTAALNLAYQTRHQRPIAGGYISLAPRGIAALENDAVLRELTGLAPSVSGRIDVNHLRSLGFSHVVLHKDRTREALAAALPTAVGFYQRREYEPFASMPGEVLERISRRFARELGAATHEDSRVRVYQLAP